MKLPFAMLASFGMAAMGEAVIAEMDRLTG